MQFLKLTFKPFTPFMCFSKCSRKSKTKSVFADNLIQTSFAKGSLHEKFEERKASNPKLKKLIIILTSKTTNTSSIFVLRHLFIVSNEKFVVTCLSCNVNGSHDCVWFVIGNVLQMVTDWWLRILFVVFLCTIVLTLVLEQQQFDRSTWNFRTLKSFRILDL